MNHAQRCYGLAEWFLGGFCSGGVLTVEAQSAAFPPRSTMGTSSLQNEAAPLALDLCSAGTRRDRTTRRCRCGAALRDGYVNRSLNNHLSTINSLGQLTACRCCAPALRAARSFSAPSDL